MLGTDFILDALAAEGLDHLFMVPGGLVDPFLPALGRQTALRPVVAAQEGGAAYMADGYARASGNFGAALVIGGPGLGNTATALQAARADGSPVLLLSGEVATALEGLGMFQDASAQTSDDVEVVRTLTRYSTSVDNPRNLHHLVRRALLEMRAPPGAPVHLSVPQDAQNGPVAVRHARIDPSALGHGAICLPAAQASLGLVRGAAGAPPVKVAVLSGHGVDAGGGADALRRFAEAWDIPVATTLRAKGVFPEDHPLSLGVFGYAGTHHARIALADAPPDLLLVLGSGFGVRDTMHGVLGVTPGRTVVVDASPVTVGRHTDGLGVVADCRAYVEWLLDARAQYGAALESTRAARAQWLAAIRAQPRLQDPEHMRSDAQPIHPARIVADLRAALPRDGILFVDSGAHRAFAGHYWTAYEPGTYVSATNLGPMGWAIPAAIGGACARPQRKVAVITGDGCMHMHGLEVATAARYGVPVVFVVVNNAALGNVWLRAHSEGTVPDALTSLPDLDWAGFARSVGALGVTVREPAALAGAFARALAATQPTVIDVKADKRCATPVADWVAASAAWSYHE
ncbi:MAG: thiamine pyrophosphate-binding protein [Burkholderiales bacterium]